jgi:DNA-directed RNA polymerase alpha subunit
MPINLSRKTIQTNKVNVWVRTQTEMQIDFCGGQASLEVLQELKSLPEKCDLEVRVNDAETRVTVETTYEKRHSLPIEEAAQEIVRYLIEDCGLDVDFDEETATEKRKKEGQNRSLKRQSKKVKMILSLYKIIRCCERPEKTAIPIEDLQLSTASYNILKCADVDTIADFLKFTPKDIECIKYFGLTRVEEVLYSVQHFLAMDSTPGHQSQE